MTGSHDVGGRLDGGDVEEDEDDGSGSEDEFDEIRIAEK